LYNKPSAAVLPGALLKRLNVRLK
jgi:hypothetical protein